MQFTCPFRVFASCHLAKVIIDPGKNREYSTQRHHIVKMRHNIVGVMVNPINTSLGQNNTGHTAHGEEEQKTKRPEHRRFKFN